MWRATLKNGEVITEEEARRQNIRFSDVRDRGIVKLEIVDRKGKCIAQVEDPDGRIFYQKCAAVSLDGKHFVVGEEIGKVTDLSKYECLVVTVENNRACFKKEIKGRRFFEIHGLL